VNPHVIFQFRWGNTLEKEKHAVDDMTMYAGVGEYEALGHPNVAYLIKAKRKGDPSPPGDSPVHGIDVYEIHPGQRMDITNPSTLTYSVGEDEDGTIKVDSVDMGLPPAGVVPLTISLARIRSYLEPRGVVFEAENQEECKHKTDIKTRVEPNVQYTSVVDACPSSSLSITTKCSMCCAFPLP
jgi:hypothetical protein